MIVMKKRKKGDKENELRKNWRIFFVCPYCESDVIIKFDDLIRTRKDKEIFTITECQCGEFVIVSSENIYLTNIEDLKIVDFERIQKVRYAHTCFDYMFDGSFNAEAAKDMIEFEKDLERESLKNS